MITIADSNKAFCDLARTIYGRGWDRDLVVNNIVDSRSRARALANKHDIEPTPAEVLELIVGARQQQTDIAVCIATLEKSMKR